ncbi:MAG: protein kinase domain-containing protein [Planctomycetota bacterium]
MNRGGQENSNPPPPGGASDPHGEKTKAPPRFDFTDENLQILRMALLEGFLDGKAVATAGALAKELQGRPIGPVLIEKKMCTRENFFRIASRLESKTLYCNRCRAFHGVEKPLEQPSCPACGTALIFFEFLEDDAAGFRGDLAAPVRGEKRYVREEEIGRGGLGRVVAAKDAVLGRDVAIKEMDRGAGDSHLLRRFLREGEIAGRLQHPNIVPVFDVGIREEEGRKIPYMVMGRIAGRDLGRIIRDVEKGEATIRATYTRHRLLSIFLDVCLAMAYAHDRGVIHRDLKPANIMVGKYGEVYVVDWGLAKIKGAPDPTGGKTHPSDSSDPDPLTDAKALEGDPGDGSCAPVPDVLLTLDGDILGTPSYMAPEQAEGRISTIDERTDVYALGTILYQILTYRPPFEGDTSQTVITQVTRGDLKPPSQRMQEMQQAVGETLSMEPIPRDLEDVVLRAMARDKQDRFPKVMDLHQEVQRFLEGEKERARKEREAREMVGRGQEALNRYRALETEIEAQHEKVKALFKEVRQWQPVEEKRVFWKAEDRLKALREERMAAFGRAEVAFGQALLADASNQEGWDGRCALYMERYLAAEQRRDREEMTLYRNLLKESDGTGRWVSEMAKPGRLSLRTYAYPCSCLQSVSHPEWRVELGRDLAWGFRDGRIIRDEDLAEEDWPIPPARTFPPHVVFGHTDACTRDEVHGVEVFLYRYVVRDRRLVPEEEKALGVTPLKGRTIPQGSYLCILRHPDYEEVRLPVRIDRGGGWEQEVNMVAKGEVPEGFCYIPGGPFVCGGGEPGAPHFIRATEDLFIGRFPVTLEEYMIYLNDLAARDPGEARTRAPREGDQRLLVEEERRWRLPGAGEGGPFPLTGDMPLIGISWLDALKYCDWRSQKDGRLYTPPHEEEWEKAARGVDARQFPWGNDYDGTFANTNVTHEKGPRPRPVDTFPIDASPYEVRGMGGNAMTWCFNGPEKIYRKFRSLRGGSFSNPPRSSLTGVRKGNEPDSVDRNYGLRLLFRARA